MEPREVDEVQENLDLLRRHPPLAKQPIAGRVVDRDVAQDAPKRHRRVVGPAVAHPHRWHVGKLQQRDRPLEIPLGMYDVGRIDERLQVVDHRDRRVAQAIGERTEHVRVDDGRVAASEQAQRDIVNVELGARAVAHGRVGEQDPMPAHDTSSRPPTSATVSAIGQWAARVPRPGPWKHQSRLSSQHNRCRSISTPGWAFSSSAGADHGPASSLL